MGQYVYLALTTDRLSLPVAVAGSPGELARILGVSSNAVSSYISKYESGLLIGDKPKYVRVDISEV